MNAFDPIEPHQQAIPISDGLATDVPEEGRAPLFKGYIRLKMLIVVIFTFAIISCSAACISFTAKEFNDLSSRLGREHMNGTSHTIHLEVSTYLESAVTIMHSWKKMWIARGGNRLNSSWLQEPDDQQWWRDMFLNNMFSSYYNYSIMSTCFAVGSYVDAYTIFDSQNVGGWLMPYNGTPRAESGHSDHLDCSWSTPSLLAKNCNATQSKYDCTKRPWYIGEREPGVVHWSPVYTTKDQGKLSTMVTSGIHDFNNVFLGVTGVVVALSHVSSILDRVTLQSGQGLSSVVASETNTVVASTMDRDVSENNTLITMDEYSQTTADLLKIQDTLEEREVVVASLDGTSCYVMKSTLQSNNLKWYSFVFVPVSNVLHEADYAMRVAVISAVVILLVWVGAVFIVLSIVMNSLQDVTDALIKLASLDLSHQPSPPSFFSELRGLQRSASIVKHNLSIIVAFLPERTSTAFSEKLPDKNMAQTAPNFEKETVSPRFKLLAPGLALQRLTVVSTSIQHKEMLQIAEETRDTTALVTQSVQWFSVLTSVSGRCKGVVHAYSEDQIITTFTNVGVDTGHEKRGVQFMHNMILNIKENAGFTSLLMTAGGTSGASCMGNLGGVNIRTHAVVGGLCHEARMLSLLCESRSCDAIVSQPTASASLGEASLRAIDRVVTSISPTPSLVFALSAVNSAVLSLSQGANQESIYEVYIHLWEEVEANKPIDVVKEVIFLDLARGYYPALRLIKRLEEHIKRGKQLSSYKVALSTDLVVKR